MVHAPARPAPEAQIQTSVGTPLVDHHSAIRAEVVRELVKPSKDASAHQAARPFGALSTFKPSDFSKL